ncbi:MAG: response regulator [Desulfobacterales bacterium]|jgi:two-component system response regulator AtoC
MKTILVVDDKRVQLKTLRRGLRTKGYHVVEAINGKEALEHLVKDSKIDIVLTDYAMPEMDGIELLKKIRENNKTIPVIIMTAYGDKNLVIEAMHHRCNGFIDKPFDMDELLEEIKNIPIK